MYFATQNLLTAFQPIAYRIILVTLLVTLKTDGVQHTFLPMFFTVIRVQVPSSAPDNDNPNPVPIGDGFGFLVYLEC